VLEAHSAQAAGLLTERIRHQLAAQQRQAPHIQASQPGELVCQEKFYVGKPKGVGKVWQYSASDAACSFAVAQVSLEFSGRAAASFLTEGVLPTYRAVGRALQRILTDQGSEYRGAFDLACAHSSIRHTRTKPRHAWTNGFVERLQGTILSELWRIEFCRRFFTNIVAMQTALHQYLDFYNMRRPLRATAPAAKHPARSSSPRRQA
jgi:transposase InsO family protein